MCVHRHGNHVTSRRAASQERIVQSGVTSFRGVTAAIRWRPPPNPKPLQRDQQPNDQIKSTNTHSHTRARHLREASVEGTPLGGRSKAPPRHHRLRRHGACTLAHASRARRQTRLRIQSPAEKRCEKTGAFFFLFTVVQRLALQHTLGPCIPRFATIVVGLQFRTRLGNPNIPFALSVRLHHQVGVGPTRCS